MAIVKLKGNEKVEVDEITGKKIQKILEEGTTTGSEWIKLGKRLTKMSELLSVELQEARASEMPQIENSKSYYDERRDLLSISPKNRARKTGMFALMYWAVTGKNQIEPELIQKVIAFQEDFFIKNPKRVLPDYLGLKKLIPEKELLREVNTFQNCALGIVSKACKEDKNLAK